MGAISSLGSFAPLGWNNSRGFAKTIASRSVITQYYIATNEVLTINCNVFFFQKMLCFESFLKYHFFKTIFVQSTYLKRSLYLRLFKEIQPNYYHLLYCTLLTVRNRSWSSKVALKLYFPLTFDALFTATYYCLTPSFAKTTHFQNNNCKKFLEFFFPYD